MGGFLTADQNPRSDPGSGGEVRSALRPPRRIVNRVSTGLGWSRHHRLQLIALAVMILTAMGVVFLLPVGSPGYAAIVGRQQITIVTLDAEVTNLKQAVKQYQAVVQLTSRQETQQTLTWLIRFKINDELGRRARITASAAQSQKALNEIYTAAKANAQRQGITNVTLNMILAANGIPPNMAAETGRYQAIDDQFAKQANEGKAPASVSAQSAVTAKLGKARCLSAKALKIQVNPQFGRFDYSNYDIVPASSTVSRSPAPTTTTSASGLTPAC